MIDTAIQALAQDIALQQENLIWQALRENGCKTTHVPTLQKRLEIQVDIDNKNKRVLLDGKLILVMSTDYQFEVKDEKVRTTFGYKILV